MADTMTRQQALAMIEEGKKNPKIVEAALNPRHLAHKLVKEYAQRLHYWAHEHPQTTDGKPVPVDQPGGSPEDELAAIDAQAMATIDAMTPEQARARIAELKGNEEFRAAFLDRKHADNAFFVEGMRRLQARAAGQAPSQAVSGNQEAIDEYNWYRAGVLIDPDHPCHEELKDKYRELYEAAYPDRAAAEDAGDGQPVGGEKPGPDKDSPGTPAEGSGPEDGPAGGEGADGGSGEGEE